MAKTAGFTHKEVQGAASHLSSGLGERISERIGDGTKASEQPSFVQASHAAPPIPAPATDSDMTRTIAGPKEQEDATVSPVEDVLDDFIGDFQAKK